MRINAYVVIADTVSQAVDYGWERAHKHTDTPSDATIKEEMERAVMNALCEVINFEDEDELELTGKED